jgi:hypothetical protein
MVEALAAAGYRPTVYPQVGRGSRGCGVGEDVAQGNKDVGAREGVL